MEINKESVKHVGTLKFILSLPAQQYLPVRQAATLFSCCTWMDAERGTQTVINLVLVSILTEVNQEEAVSHNMNLAKTVPL